MNSDANSLSSASDDTTERDAARWRILADGMHDEEIAGALNDAAALIAYKCQVQFSAFPANDEPPETAIPKMLDLAIAAAKECGADFEPPVAKAEASNG